MKNTFIKLSIAAIIAASGVAHAGLLGFNGGIGGGIFNNNEPTGVYSDGKVSLDLVDTLNLTPSTSYYAWGYVEHPIPLLPNIRLEMNQDKYNGTKPLSLSVLGKTFNNDVSTVLDLSSNDLIFYWGVPLTGIMSTITPLVDYDLDFGIGIKQYNGSFSITDQVGAVSVTQDLSEAMLGYGYLKGRVEAFGAGVEGQVKYASYLDNSFTEYSIKADYVIPVTPIIDVGVELGYKQTDLTIDVDSGAYKIQTNLQTNGLFFGGFVKF